MLQALAAPALTAGSARAQTRPPPIAEAALLRCRHPRLDIVSGTVVQRSIHGDPPQPDAAPAAGLGVRQGERLRIAGHRRRAAGVHASIEERRDRRVSAPGDRVQAVAVPLWERLPGPVRVQQWSAVEPGHRRRPSVHARRRGDTPLLGAWVWRHRLDARPSTGVPNSSGLLRNRLDTPDRRLTFGDQRRRTRWWTDRGRAGHRDGPGDLACRF